MLGNPGKIHERRSIFNPQAVTYSVPRTKASIIYRDGNLRAAQVLLGHSNSENTMRNLRVDIEDALSLAENTGIYAIGSSLAAKSQPNGAWGRSDGTGLHVGPASICDRPRSSVRR